MSRFESCSPTRIPPTGAIRRAISRRSLIGVGAGLGLALAGGRPVRAGGSAVRIGALYNLTGDIASIDVPGLQGMQLAARQINERGGVLGRPLELVTIDGESDPERVAAAARRMIAEGTVAIGGLDDSDSAEAVGRAAQAAGIPFVTAGATLPTLPTLIGDRCFMACYGDDAQARAGAGFAVSSLRARTAWLLSDTETLYTAALARYFTEAFTAAGGTIALADTYTSGVTDFSAPIARLRALATVPDVLYVAAMPAEAGPIVLQLRQADFARPILSGDGFDTPEVIDVAGRAADGVRYSTHVAYDNPAPPVQTFVAAYSSMFGAPPDTAFAALGYDTLRLIVDAIDRAGSTAPPALRDALAATRGFVGVTGAISYATGVRTPIKPVTIVGINDGRPSFIELVQPT